MSLCQRQTLATHLGPGLAYRLSSTAVTTIREPKSLVVGINRDMTAHPPIRDWAWARAYADTQPMHFPACGRDVVMPLEANWILFAAEVY